MSKPAPGPKFVLRGHVADVQALCFHPKLKILYSGDANGIVKAWDLVTYRPIQSFSLHTPEAGILALHHLAMDSSQLLSQGRDGCLKCWELDEEHLPSGVPKLILQTLSHSFCRCLVLTTRVWPPKAFPYSDGIIASNEIDSELHFVALPGSEPSDIELWCLEWGKLARTLSQPEGMKCGMCMSLGSLQNPNSLLVLSGYEDGSIAFWDIGKPSKPLTTCKPHSEPVFALASFQEVAFTASAEDFLQKLSLDLEIPEIGIHKNQSFKEGGVSDILISKDGKVIFTGGWDKKLRVFSTKNLRPLAILQYHRAGIAVLALEPQSQLLVSGSRDSTIAFWDVFSKA